MSVNQGLSSDADLYLFSDINGNGVFEAGEMLAYSISAGASAEIINFDNLGSGQYLLQVNAFSGSTNYNLNLALQENAQGFSQFSVQDASGDSSATHVFQAGALRVNYDWNAPSNLQQVQIELWQGGQKLGSIGSSTASQMADGLIDLSDFTNLTAGEYQLRSVAQLISGQEIASEFENLTILDWDTNQIQRGDFSANHFTTMGKLAVGMCF